MDAFELLKQDHQKVSKLFSEIESASGNSKTQLFARLKAELDLHAHIEETILYPALENTDEAREITLEAYEEHKVVKDLLGELAAAATPSDAWDAKLTVLKENVEHHVEEEEGELFDKARKALGEERIERLGAEMEGEKARQVGTAKSTAAATTTKVPARKSAEPESPGVLQRLANLVGLGESRPSESEDRPAKPAVKGRKAVAGRATVKSPSKSPQSVSSSAAKAKPVKSVSKSGASASRAKSATSTKKAVKPAKKSAAKKRTSRKAAPKNATKKSAGPSRASATKTASRAASNQNVKSRGTRGTKSTRTTKSSSKTRSKAR